MRRDPRLLTDKLENESAQVCSRTTPESRPSELQVFGSSELQNFITSEFQNFRTSDLAQILQSARTIDIILTMSAMTISSAKQFFKSLEHHRAMYFRKFRTSCFRSAKVLKPHFQNFSEVVSMHEAIGIGTLPLQILDGDDKHIHLIRVSRVRSARAGLG